MEAKGRFIHKKSIALIYNNELYASIGFTKYNKTDDSWSDPVQIEIPSTFQENWITSYFSLDNTLYGHYYSSGPNNRGSIVVYQPQSEQ